MCSHASVLVESLMTSSAPLPRQVLNWHYLPKASVGSLLLCLSYSPLQSESEVTQSCPTLHDPMDCSLPGSSIHGIFQARAPEWVIIAFSICKANLILSRLQWAKGYIWTKEISAFPHLSLSATQTLITHNVWFPVSLEVHTFLCLLCTSCHLQEVWFPATHSSGHFFCSCSLPACCNSIRVHCGQIH